MPGLLEDLDLRDKSHVFSGRKEAGRALARMLSHLKGTDSMVLAIPSGGVPVAAEISRALCIPVDLLVLRKIQIPWNPEAGFGALAPDGTRFMNDPLLRTLGLTGREVEQQLRQTLSILRKREEVFRKGRAYPSFEGKTVIITDDGLASGYTMLAAVRFIRKSAPEKVIVAVPTSSARTADFILREADELCCPNIRRGPVFAVADAYVDWYDLSDGEVLEILAELEKEGLYPPAQ
jgi:predicted phosphoribosyltransferase